LIFDIKKFYILNLKFNKFDFKIKFQKFDFKISKFEKFDFKILNLRI